MTNANALFLVLILAPTAYADTVRYVSDSLEIQLRSGKTFKHAILKTLPSGVQVTVTQADADGYSRVRTRDGVEGWILTRYLSSVPSARDRLAETEQRLAAFKIENAQLKEQIGGDVITLTGRDLPALRAAIHDRFAFDAEPINGHLRIERPRAHEFVPQLVEALPGLIESVSIGKPTLEDVFIHATGHRWQSHAWHSHEFKDDSD